ncbi:MAG TPA: hypothetical protein VFE97_20910 [Methylomirabilota bacterium]|nr:hypothetical protein [Methylomirabilota bacterium]
MDSETIRFLIRYKLQRGRLPYDGPSKICEPRAVGDVCAACGALVESGHLVQPATRDGALPLQLHARCFELWNEERHAASE